MAAKESHIHPLHHQQRVRKIGNETIGKENDRKENPPPPPFQRQSVSCPLAVQDSTPNAKGVGGEDSVRVGGASRFAQPVVLGPVLIVKVPTRIQIEVTI